MTAASYYLSCLLLDPAACERAPLVTEFDFDTSRERSVFVHAARQYREHRRIDLSDLRAELGPDASSEYLAELLQLVPTAANVEQYAGMLRL